MTRTKKLYTRCLDCRNQEFAGCHKKQYVTRDDDNEKEFGFGVLNNNLRPIGLDKRYCVFSDSKFTRKMI